MKILTCLLLLALCSCASSRKDIYFRTRLPTIETIDMGEAGRFGVNLDVESQRFQVQATNDIVNNPRFVKDRARYLSEGELSIKGMDAAVTFSEMIRMIPVQFALSLDHAEFKLRLFDLRKEDKTGWVGLINYGYYRTATYEESESCFFICLSSQKDREAAQAQKDTVSTTQSGAEEKVGTTLGYYLSESSSIFGGYNWYDARIKMEAYYIKTDTRINFNERFYGSGFGLGYLYKFPRNASIALTLEHIKMDWNGIAMETDMVGVRSHISF